MTLTAVKVAVWRESPRRCGIVAARRDAEADYSSLAVAARRLSSRGKIGCFVGGTLQYHQTERMTVHLPPLPKIILEPVVQAALLEDIGRAGDITTDAIAPIDLVVTASLIARHSGVVAGLDLAALSFRLIDERAEIERLRHDGDTVVSGEAIAVIRGPARAVLTAERTGLNFLGRLSGIASATAAMVAAVAEGKARVVCTRKTTPGLRAIEKYAVRAGGGANHRFGLDDAVLVKDNHIAIAGDVTKAIERVRARVGHLVKIEVEVDTLEQLQKALAVGVDAVLLDNMTIEQLRSAVNMVAGRAITEASGGVTPETAPAIATTGVDLISVGWLTHSAPVLDIGLDFRNLGAHRLT